MFKSVVRYSSTIPIIKPRPTFRDLLRTPAAKSLFLTVVFGSAVTEMIAQRKAYDTLIDDHNTKMSLLKDIAMKLKNGEQVDLQQELKMLKNKGEVDIDIDETLNEFLSSVEGKDTGKAVFI